MRKRAERTQIWGRDERDGNECDRNYNPARMNNFIATTTHQSLLRDVYNFRDLK